MAKKHIANDQLGELYQNETTKLLGKTLTRVTHDSTSRNCGAALRVLRAEL